MPLGCFLLTLPLIRQTAREHASPVLANSMLYALLLQLFITQHFILERLSIYVSMFSLLALPAAVCAPCGRIPPRVRTGLLIGGALAYFLFAAAQGFHGVYPYRGIWERAMIP